MSMFAIVNICNLFIETLLRMEYEADVELFANKSVSNVLSLLQIFMHLSTKF